MTVSSIHEVNSLLHVLSYIVVVCVTGGPNYRNSTALAIEKT